MSSPLDRLLERRLLIVTGKGGTGKSTVAAALSLLAARRGLETVTVELGEDRSLVPLLVDRPEAVPTGDGREPVRIAPHLHTLRIEPLEALTEYLELQLHVRALVGFVTRNAAFRRLLDAAPGWRDLITLGKLWHLESRRDGERPRWDLVVVDAPATGHGVSFLSVPRVVVETVRMGPLRRHTDWVHALLTDPARTLVVPVTLPEELPVRETVELCGRVRELGFSTGPVVANGVESRPPIADPGPVLEILGRIPPEDAPPELPPKILAECLDHCVRRAALHEMFLGELRANGSKTGIAEIPFLAGGVSSLGDTERVAHHLEGSLGSEAGR